MTQAHFIFDGMDRPDDGIGDYTRALRDAVARTTALDVSLGTLATPVPRETRTVVLEYNPFAYGRRGVSAGVVWMMSRLRRRGVRTVLMVHEPYVAVTSSRTTVLAAMQRLQLEALKQASVVVVAPSAGAARRSRGVDCVIPVGSNVPDCRGVRGRVRERLHTRTTRVLGVFAGGRAGHLPHLVTAAARAVSERCGTVELLLLGRDPMRPQDLPPAVRVVRPGRLEPAELARRLAAADVFLATYDDGVSMRRTTLAAALQHGLPVVGTRGRDSDAVYLDRPALALAAPGDHQRFADHAVALIGDPARRERASDDARALYDSTFSWEAIAELWTAVLEG
jgi:hypothetical protein